MDRRTVVYIDEKSLSAIGRWSWGRDTRLMDELFDYYHIRLLGFDIVFSKTDDSSGW